MSRKLKADNIEWWYNPYKLKAIFLYRGYDDFKAPAARLLNVSEASVPYKINHGSLTHDDTIALARGLNMTPREYCDVFMQGVFTPAEEE